jgi:hypothetical protein
MCDSLVQSAETFTLGRGQKRRSCGYSARRHFLELLGFEAVPIASLPNILGYRCNKQRPSWFDRPRQLYAKKKGVLVIGRRRIEHCQAAGPIAALIAGLWYHRPVKTIRLWKGGQPQ